MGGVEVEGAEGTVACSRFAMFELMVSLKINGFLACIANDQRKPFQTAKISPF